jgi:amino acid transporter
MSKAPAAPVPGESSGAGGRPAKMSVRGAAFIGIGSMVGAGIFALLGQAGAYAGSALWISFLLAGGIALLQGYSFALFGAKYPSAGGLFEYLAHGFGNGHITGMTAWLIFAVNAIITSLVAVSFGNYAAALFIGDDAGQAAVKLFAVALVVVLAAVNTGGAGLIEKAQSAIVWPLIGVLVGFAVLGLAQINPDLLAPSTYPPARDIFSSVGLTFFAFLGFAIVSFTAGDLENPRRDLPRAMFIALGVTTALYVAVALAVFGTLTVDEVIASGETALAKAAEPFLGQAGYTIMAIAALLATSSSVNAGLYPANGMSTDLVAKGQFPPVLARRVRGGTMGLLVTTGLTLLLAVVFDLSAIANMGSAAALLGFLLVSIAHLRVVGETGAKRWIILLGALVTAGTFVYFTITTVAKDPPTLVALILIIVLAILLDFIWKRIRDRRTSSDAQAA